VYKNALILHYLMDGKKDSNWMHRKEKTVLDSGHSSLYTFLTVNSEYKIWKEEDDYAVCSGGFPIIENGVLNGVICVSGLEHFQDHNLIVEVLNEYLKK